MSDDLLIDGESHETLFGILKKQGADYVVSFIPTDDVYFVEKWQHTFVVLIIVLIVGCLFGWMALWERLSRLRMFIVIVLIFFFVYTIQTFVV